MTTRLMINTSDAAASGSAVDWSNARGWVIGGVIVLGLLVAASSANSPSSAPAPTPASSSRAVAASFVPTPTAPAVIIRVRVTAQAGLNVRAGPSVTYAVRRKLPFATEVLVTCQVIGGPATGAARWNRLPDGSYLAADWVTVIAPPGSVVPPC